MRHMYPNPRRSSTMRKFRISLVAVAVVALTAATAASALAPKNVLFTAKYAGQASAKVVEGSSTANLSPTGTGTATLIGAGKLTGIGTGDSSQQPCVPFGGTGSMTGAS